MSATLTQVFYSKLAGAPVEYLRSIEGRAVIQKAANLIREREGEVEAEYFLNLMTVSEVIA